MKRNYMIVFLMLIASVVNASLYTAEYSGDLTIVSYMGYYNSINESLYGWLEFGIKDLNGNDVVLSKSWINNGTIQLPMKQTKSFTVTQGDELDFYIRCDLSLPQENHIYADSTRLGTVNETDGDLSAFTDVDNSLGFNGSIVKRIDNYQWYVYMNIPLSGSLDNDMDMLFKIQNYPIPEPTTIVLLGLGVLGLKRYKA